MFYNTNKPSYIRFPDGKLGARPSDGHKEWFNGEIYTWDNEIDHWSDSSGKIFHPIENWNEEDSSLPRGAFSNKTQEKSESERMKEFFFSKKSYGCECGAWAVDGAKHSSYCRLYVKEGGNGN